MNGGFPRYLYQVADTMPKGIILQDWEYLLANTYTRLQNWNNKGLSSVGAPFGVYNPGIANIWWWGHSVKIYDTLGMDPQSPWPMYQGGNGRWGRRQ